MYEVVEFLTNKAATEDSASIGVEGRMKNARIYRTSSSTRLAKSMVTTAKFSAAIEFATLLKIIINCSLPQLPYTRG